VLKLRAEFGVRQGTKGKLLYVPQQGGTQRAMYWSEFVTFAFGAGERHINRLLGIPADPKESAHPKKSKNYKLGFADGQAAALQGPVQAPPEAQPASKLDKQDPYAYFEQLKCEKQTRQRRMCRSLMPMISAACHHVIFFAMARKITSCTFIARSIAAFV
jgi:hypothetical protein